MDSSIIVRFQNIINEINCNLELLEIELIDYCLLLSKKGYLIRIRRDYKTWTGSPTVMMKRKIKDLNVRKEQSSIGASFVFLDENLINSGVQLITLPIRRCKDFNPQKDNTIKSRLEKLDNMTVQIMELIDFMHINQESIASKDLMFINLLREVTYPRFQIFTRINDDFGVGKSIKDKLIKVYSNLVKGISSLMITKNGISAKAEIQSIDYLSHIMCFWDELGLLDYLKEKQKNGSDLSLAKLIVQLMHLEDSEEKRKERISTIVGYFKKLRNTSDQIKTKNALKTVAKLNLDHSIIGFNE